MLVALSGLKSAILDATLLALAFCGATALSQDARQLEVKSFKIERCEGKGASAQIEGDSIVMKSGNDPDSAMHASADVDAKAGVRYLFSIEAKTSGRGHLFCSVQFLDAHGALLKNAAFASERMSAKKNAGRMECIATAVPDTKKLRINLTLNDPDTAVAFSKPILKELPFVDGMLVSSQKEAPLFDGSLESPFWRNATDLGGMVENNSPDKRSPFNDRILASVCDGWLYFGFKLEEPDVKGIKSGSEKAIYSADDIEVFISQDGKALTQILVAPSGVKRQLEFKSGSSSWAPAPVEGAPVRWDAKTRIEEGFWTCAVKVRVSDIAGETSSKSAPLHVNFTRHRMHGSDDLYTWTPLKGDWMQPWKFASIAIPMQGCEERKSLPGEVFSFTKRYGAPEILIPGVPLKLERRNGFFRLPAAYSIEEAGVALNPGVKAMIEGLPEGRGCAKLVLKVDKSLEAIGGGLHDPQNAFKGPEAFAMEIGECSVAITGRTEEGLLRGVATFIVMSRRAAWNVEPKLPCLWMADAPRLAYRSWMMGGWLPDGRSRNLAELKSFIDAAFLLRFNKVLIAADNSFGKRTAFPFNCGIGDGSLSKADWMELFDYARARKVEPIPFLSSWGRIEYISSNPALARYMVPISGSQSKDLPGYRNLDAANPDAAKFMLDLQAELLDTVGTPVLHIGYDESLYSEHVNSDAARAKGWTRADWIVETLSLQSKFLKSRNVELHLWGDMLDENQCGGVLELKGKSLFAKIPKDEIVVYDWKYGPSKDFPSVQMFVENGFKKVVGCCWTQPANVAGMVDSVKRYGAWGVCQTSWKPSDPDKAWAELRRAVSLSAYLSWSPENCDLNSIEFVPDTLFECAARRQRPPATAFVSVRAPESSLSPEAAVAEALGFPADADLSFLKGRSIVDCKGRSVQPFSRAGRPAAIILEGGSSRKVELKFEGSKAKQILLLQTTNAIPRMSEDLDLQERDIRFNARVGKFAFRYVDGSKAAANILLEVHAGCPDNSNLGAGMTPALFGVLNGSRFLNLPSFELENPHPEKEIESLELAPGGTNVAGIDLLIFGVSLER